MYPFGRYFSAACVVLAISVFTSPVAFGDGQLDRVPQDFPTIQDAVDNGTAPKIYVGRGTHAGAVVDRAVELVGRGQCVIDQGVEVTPGVEAGFVLLGDASGTKIRGFIFDNLDLGIYSSFPRNDSVASDVVVAHNQFLNNSQGITVIEDGTVAGRGHWLIEHNRFHDIRSDIGSGCGGGLGVFLVNGEGAVVRHNSFSGTLFAPPCGPFSTAAIFLTGTRDCFVVQNDINMGDGGQPYKFDVALFGFQPGGGPNYDTVVVNNDFRGSDAPFSGINFASFDGFQLAAQGNFGTTYIDHEFGDGASEFYTETNRRRRDLQPNDALSTPAVFGQN